MKEESYGPWMLIKRHQRGRVRHVNETREGVSGNNSASSRYLVLGVDSGINDLKIRGKDRENLANNRDSRDLEEKLKVKSSDSDQRQPILGNGN